MEMTNIDPHDIVSLIKGLIEIHRKWIVDGVSDAEDMENERAGVTEQQVAIDAFAAQRGLSDGECSNLSTAIRQFLHGGPTGAGDGPLVEDMSEDVYRAFAVRLSDVIATGNDVREIFSPVPE
jgi:hypothetical protein